ncbi:MAG: polyprenyl synthetase family protein, partial [Candidatus Puniceispirillales bacterium]
GILHVAAAFECLHAYSLIHDDLPAMDDAATRRGKPSCHLAFDQATAILAGDALQSLAFQLLSAPAIHPDPFIRAELVQNLASAAGDAGMAGGQMLDLEAETQTLDYAATARMQALKTGALITASVLAGGQYAGATPDILSELANYGKAIGQAFQIADDLLDADGDEQLVGKPLGQDDWRGKATFVAYLGLDGARQEARNQIDIARQSLARIKANNPLWQGYLDDMAQYIITRNA